MLEELGNEVLKNDRAEDALEVFDDHLKQAFSKLTDQLAHMRECKQKLKGRLTETADQTGPSSSLSRREAKPISIHWL